MIDRETDVCYLELLTFETNGTEAQWNANLLNNNNDYIES